MSCFRDGLRLRGMDCSIISTLLLFTIVLIGQVQLVTCARWTFSLRISSPQCCRSPSCEQVGSCEDLVLVVCLRIPGTPMEDRHNCPFFIAGNSSSLLDRDITSGDKTNSGFEKVPVSYVTSPYEGGIQLLIGMVTEPDLPPLDEDILIYEFIVELERRPGAGECSAVTVTGPRENVTVSLTVDCYPGFSEEDCTCKDNCEPNTFTSVCVSPTPTPPPPTGPPLPPSKVPTSSSEAISTSSAGGQSSTGGPTQNPLLLPVGAGLGGFVVLLLLLLIALVGLLLYYRRRRDRKSQRIDLWKLSETQSIPPLEPLKTTVPPNDVVDDGVTYSAVAHRESNGHHSMVYEEELEDEKENVGQSGGEIVYADLDHDTQPLHAENERGPLYVDVDYEPRATFSTFKKRFSGRKRKPPVALPNTTTTAAAATTGTAEGTIEYSMIQREQPHKYINVGTGPQPKLRKKQPREENNYSTVPRTVLKVPSNSRVRSIQLEYIGQ